MIRRLSDVLRILADDAWEKGKKDVSTLLHEAAYTEENRKVEDERRKT